MRAIAIISIALSIKASLDADTAHQDAIQAHQDAVQAHQDFLDSQKATQHIQINTPTNSMAKK